MPTLAPPPYQSASGSLQWQAWYRQINDLLEGLSLSIGQIDDINITAVADNQFLSYNSTSGVWENLSDLVIPGTIDSEGAVTVNNTLQVTGDVDAEAEVQALTMGAGIARTEGTLHVHTATAGTVTAQTGADDLVIENNVSGGISILVPDDRPATLAFGSPTDNIGAQLFFDYDDGILTLASNKGSGQVELGTASGTSAIRINATQDVGVGTVGPSSRLHVTDSSALGPIIDSTLANSSSLGPVLLLRRNQATTPEDNDGLGSIDFYGYHDGSATSAAIYLYSRVCSVMTDVTEDSEDSVLIWQTSVSGTIATRLTQGAGLYSAANVDSGVNTCNFSSYYVGGTAGADFGPSAVTSITVVKGIVTAIS